MQVLINVDVPNIHAAREFYERALGLRLKRLLFDNTVAEMQGGSASLFLTLKEEGSSPSRATTQLRHYGRHWTPIHLDYVVECVEAAVSKACEAGASLEGEIESFPWGYLATMSDPFGNGFCLIQWQGRGYDDTVSS